MSTFPADDAPLPDVGPVWRALEMFRAELERRLPTPIDPESKCKTQERAERFRREWRASGRGRRDAALLVDLLGIWASSPKVTGKWWAETKADQKRLAGEVEALLESFRQQTVLPFLKGWHEHVYRRAVRLLTRARETARAERRRHNALSFNDLLLTTAGVLRTDAGVRRALQQKYRWLFVDEFQDTDPVQAEIMFLLASEDDTAAEAATGPANWRAVSLRPGALFVVGDPKQSIYRFRRADIDIYNEVRGRMGGPDGAGIVTLTTNFRSVPALCDWANQVFAERFPESPTPQAPRFARLSAYRDPHEGDAPIAVIDLPSTIASSDVPAEEAARIARYIRGEVDAGRRRSATSSS